MYLADTLSRAFLPEVNACEFSRELEEVDHKAFLAVTDSQWHQIKHASADDPVLQQLRTTIKDGRRKDQTFPNPSTRTTT